MMLYDLCATARVEATRPGFFAARVLDGTLHCDTLGSWTGAANLPFPQGPRLAGDIVCGGGRMIIALEKNN